MENEIENPRKKTQSQGLKKLRAKLKERSLK